MDFGELRTTTSFFYGIFYDYGRAILSPTATYDPPNFLPYSPMTDGMVTIGNGSSKKVKFVDEPY
jgi:hypothetical protein